MVYPGNGRTVKIPIQVVKRQLPAVEEISRPLLKGPDDSQGEVVEARPQVEAEAGVESQIADWESGASRWGTELEDALKRSERRIEIQVREERQRLLNRLLSVADNLERGLTHSDSSDSLRAGIQLTLDDLRRQLAQEGVEPIEALGRPFDPTLHEAIATDGSDGDTVVEVLQTGYTLDGKLLRPARVAVGRPV